MSVLARICGIFLIAALTVVTGCGKKQAPSKKPSPVQTGEALPEPEAAVRYTDPLDEVLVLRKKGLAAEALQLALALWLITSDKTSSKISI